MGWYKLYSGQRYFFENTKHDRVYYVVREYGNKDADISGVRQLFCDSVRSEEVCYWYSKYLPKPFGTRTFDLRCVNDTAG